MTYTEATDYLFTAAPMFQTHGGDAYKPGLDTSLALDSHYGHPHQSYHVIHVAGTNGKGSVCHTLAAILRASGHRVGLYTSPHLLDFRERIRVDGEMIPQERVTRFVEQERHFFEPLHPSFFELTTALALLHFREQRVDVAVIETGMGGRLDSTNIIPRPLVTIITNVSLDHTQYLGSTLPQIAHEKAGIMKEGVPAVIGETGGNPEVKAVFRQRAQELHCPITFADQSTGLGAQEGSHRQELISSTRDTGGHLHYRTRTYGLIHAELSGLCQPRNTRTTLAAVHELTHRLGLPITPAHVREGLSQVQALTGGPIGRWQEVSHHPRIICDIAHNPAGLRLVSRQLRREPHAHLYIILGMCRDKDVAASLAQLPRGRNVTYLFTQATTTRRAAPPQELARIARQQLMPHERQPHEQRPHDSHPHDGHLHDGHPHDGLQDHGHQDQDLQDQDQDLQDPIRTSPTVPQALQAALREADPATDLIFVGGSAYIVADLLAHLPRATHTPRT